MAVCCGCNRRGSCKGCVCVKARRPCVNCQLSRIGSCQNAPSHHRPSLSPRSLGKVEHMSEHVSESTTILTENTSRSATPAPQHSLGLSATDPVVPLPEYTVMPDPLFVWGDLDGPTFSLQIRSCYAEVVHWKRNLFKIPSGKTGAAFVRELSHLFNSYACSSALESVALYAAMAMPHLLLQRPLDRCSIKQSTSLLARHLILWSTGDINQLLEEGRAIQARLPIKSYRGTTTSDQLARKFSNLMFTGNVTGAIRLLSDSGCGGSLPCHWKQNCQRHPPGETSRSSTAIFVCSYYSVLFVRLPPCYL